MIRQRSHARTLMMLLAAVCLTAVPKGWAAGDESLSRAERAVLWGRNMELIRESRDAPVPEKIEALAATAPVEEKVKHWLDSYRQDLATMTKAKIEEYDSYVARAKEHLEKGELREALIESYRAKNYAPDEQKFFASEWLADLEGRAVAKAEELRQASKWNKAHAYYYDLSSLFEDNKVYETRRRECLSIARLDAIYEPADEEDDPHATRWQEMLEGIDRRNAEDALDRIGRFYVEDVDFREIMGAGIEHLILFNDSKKMRETFPGLDDDVARADFRDRMNSRLKRVQDGRSRRFGARAAQQTFRRILEINEQTIRLPEELIVYEFMAGALEPLDDFTSVIWPIEFKEFDKHTRGDFVGVGISITGGGANPVMVVSPLEDTPAFRAGVLPEDEIKKVNGEAIDDLSLNKVVNLITGAIDTEVTLTIYRKAEERTFDVTLKRALVKIQSVKGIERDADDPSSWDYMIDYEMGIGYARVNSFQENSVEQLDEAIQEMQAKGLRGLILDLRFNPGGLMRSAIDMAQLFLERDDVVVSTRGMRDAPWQNPQPPRGGPYRELPLVVLVNEYSASASEIVSGALQDHDRALIIGDRTFGKFSVQKLMQLGGGVAHLKLTTARYYLPSGRSLHHDEGVKEWGIMPDFEHKVVPKELMRIQQMWRDRDIIGEAPQAAATDDESEDAGTESTDESEETEVAQSDEASADEIESDAESSDDAATAEDEDDVKPLNLARDPNTLPEVDLQLETALLLMRLHLLGERQLEVAAAGKSDNVAGEVRNP